jgi:hypothetical protein
MAAAAATGTSSLPVHFRGSYLLSIFESVGLFDLILNQAILQISAISVL